jgi:hypothetical protein
MGLVASVVVAVMSAQAQSAPSLWFPERQGGVLSLSSELRLGMPVEHLRVGGVLDASATWHAPFPLGVRVRAWPLALFSTGRYASSPPAGLAGVGLEVFFDSSAVAAGLEVGFGMYEDADIDRARDYLVAPVGGVLLRLGPQDGIHLLARARVGLRPWGWQFSALEVQAQVPLAPGWWLRGRASGDASSLGVFDLGVRVALDRDVARPASFLTPMAGLVLFADRFGPMIGFGFEHRIH